MTEEIESADKVGSVSVNRYAEIVAELRKLVETASRIQFTVGDYALEVEPMREAGGQERSDALFRVKDSLFRLAEDIGLSYAMVDKARWTASKWPKDRRVAGVSFTVHNILAAIADDEDRFTTILNPPEGKSRWTPDEANPGDRGRHPLRRGYGLQVEGPAQGLPALAHVLRVHGPLGRLRRHRADP